MALDIFFWLGWIAFSAVLVMLVYVFLAYLRPAMQTFAWLVIKAKRRKQPFIALDAGSRWVFKVGKKSESGVIMPDDMIPVEVTPKSLKYGGGILFGVGELFRSKLANIKLVDLLTKARAEGWDAHELARKIATIDELVAQEIRILEDGKDVRKEEEAAPTADSGDASPDGAETEDTVPLPGGLQRDPGLDDIRPEQDTIEPETGNGGADQGRGEGSAKEKG